MTPKEKELAIGKALEDFQETLKKIGPLDHPKAIVAAAMAFGVFKSDIFHILAAPNRLGEPGGPKIKNKTYSD